MNEAKQFVFTNDDKECIVTMSISLNSINEYKILYSYSEFNNAHPFHNCSPPGIKQQYEREHETGSIVFKNSLTDCLIDFILNNKNIHDVDNEEHINIFRQHDYEIKFKDPVVLQRDKYIECNYTITLLERNTSYSIYYTWDEFNHLHPQYYPYQREETTMKYSFIKKNKFTKLLIDYLFMDEEELGKKIGFFTPQEYKKQIINRIIPAIVEKDDSIRTIITCIIPALWE